MIEKNKSKSNRELQPRLLKTVTIKVNDLKLRARERKYIYQIIAKLFMTFFRFNLNYSKKKILSFYSIKGINSVIFLRMNHRIYIY
jgi:hypothetical protein